MTRLFLSGAALALVSGIAAPSIAQETYPNAPFRTHPALLAQAAALQRIAVTAEASARPAVAADRANALEDADAGEAEEEDEGLVASTVPLFEASLTAKAPDTAAALRAALEAMLEARAEGSDATEAARDVAGLITEARAALLPADVMDTAPMSGALLAALLLDEGGVAESYEEASGGEAEAYVIGRTALGRAKSLWDGLKGRGAPDVVAEGDAALARLDALFPSAEMPARLSPDPEEAEAPAHRLVGLAEGVTRADLYPGRDLDAAADVVGDLAARGCATSAADAAMGRELLAIAAAYHGELLAAPLSVMAPEAEERITASFGEAGEAPDCGALLDALGAAREALAS